MKHTLSFYPLVEKHFSTLFTSLIFALLFHSNVFGQMSLVSSYPADGAVAVDTVVTMSLTFSQPIDTTARFEGSFINKESNSDPQNEYSMTLSPDMKTVNYHNLHLSSDTKYTHIILGVRSTNGDMLDRPYIVHFTTGNTLPTTTISGKVAFPEGDPRNAIVALTKPDFGVSGGTVVTETVGSYHIPFVQPGDYQVVVVMDVNHDGEISVEGGGDIMSFYDPDEDGTPNIITVGGEDVVDIDFQLQPPEAKTAAGSYPAAEAIALVTASDCELVLIMSETADSVGMASEWQYWFYSESKRKIYALDFLGSALVEEYEINVAGLEIESLGANWIDSDSALVIANTNGGYEFRQNDSDVRIGAMLANSSLIPLLMTMDEGDDAFKIPIICRLLKRPNVQTSLISQAPQTPSNNFWYIDYNSERYEVFIDADAGVFIPPITAKNALAVVEDFAYAEAEDAQTYFIEPETIRASGTAYTWHIVYYSASQIRYFGFIVIASSIVFPLADVNVQPPIPLSEQWIDSDSALSITEAYGGNEFRTQVSEWYLAVNMKGNYWFITYLSDSSDDWMRFVLDAASGHIMNISGSRVQTITARANIAKADSAAQEVAVDAQLVYLTRTGVDPQGAANRWRSFYFSSSLDSLFGFDVYEKYLVSLLDSQIPENLEPPFSPIPENCIDSDSALAIAEENGGLMFREMIERWRLSASLDSTHWIVAYRSQDGSDWLEFTIDAVTAELVDKQGTPPFVSAAYYLTHDAGNLRVSVFGNGYIGQTLTPNGDGVNYSDHGNALYVGSFMIGTPEHVHGMVYDKPNDMVNTIPLQAFTSDEHFDQISYSAFSDSGAVNPFGIIVHQFTYSKVIDNCVIFKYQIHNHSDETLQSLVAGIFADWDIADAQKNLGGYDVDRGLAYQYEAGENISDSTYYGVVALTQMAGVRVTTLKEFSNPDTIYSRMSTFYNESIEIPGDYRTYIGSGPFDLESEGERIVAFAITAGKGLTELQANADAAREMWNSLFVGVEKQANSTPLQYQLSQNYPNPFNPSTTIEFSIPTPSHVSLKVYDVLGREVKRLVDEKKPVGVFRIKFDAGELANGVYFFTFQAGKFKETKKCLLIR